jgi:trk system potassium uptake protein TrkH
MLEKPLNRYVPIVHYIGVVMIGLGFIQMVPLITALLYREWSIFFIFLLTASFAILIGGLAALICNPPKNVRLSWGEGMLVSAASWVIGMLICALPYYLSGSYLSYLDACFDVMSGLTTTGLVLIQDIDHLSNGINMWRHLLTFVGGQGMVVLALSFLVKGTSGAYKMYVGEGKDERLAPNVINTARHIWKISLIYLVIGTSSIGVANLLAGMSVDRAFLHGIWIFMSAWSTGGFAPMSQNILYYHSLLVEVVSMVFFVIGSFNFALHFAVISGKRRELYKNIETMSFSVTVTILTVLTTVGLMKAGVYTDTMALFRKGFYQLLSGHTTTGFMTIYARQFYHEWGDLALFAIIIAMLIGGSACSTAGGFKGLRMGIIFHAFKKDIRKLGQPESMISMQKMHHIKDIEIDDNITRSAMLIVIAYILTFVIATLNGMLGGFSFLESAFESASVTGNVGLTIGVTSPAMPAFLKITYIISMWIARLEFVSILALGAYLMARARGKWQKI